MYFINNADDSDQVPNVDKDQQKYSSYRFSDTEWGWLERILKVLRVRISTSSTTQKFIIGTQASAKVHEEFSAEHYPTVWRVLPIFENFMTEWHQLANDPDMEPLRPAIMKGLSTLEKYYNKTENSPAHVVAMCESSFSICNAYLPRLQQTLILV